jgi:2-iminobutanoate/2-iminopropanoate deaminase
MGLVRLWRLISAEAATGDAMSKTAITSPELAPPVGPFSQAVKIDGFLFFSGQVAQDPATGKVVGGGIVAETERVLQNLSAVLKAAGRSFDDVVRAGVFLTNMGDFAAMNAIYAKYFAQRGADPNIFGPPAGGVCETGILPVRKYRRR